MVFREDVMKSNAYPVSETLDPSCQSTSDLWWPCNSSTARLWERPSLLCHSHLTLLLSCYGYTSWMTTLEGVTQEVLIMLYLIRAMWLSSNSGCSPESRTHSMAGEARGNVSMFGRATTPTLSLLNGPEQHHRTSQQHLNSWRLR